jgi:hypothetical protein
MLRNTFAAITTLALSAGAASAATPATVSGDQSLEARVQAAQSTLSKLMDAAQAQTEAQTGDQVAYWANHYRRPWHNWNNWRNYNRYYY